MKFLILSLVVSSFAIAQLGEDHYNLEVRLLLGEDNIGWGANLTLPAEFPSPKEKIYASMFCDGTLPEKDYFPEELTERISHHSDIKSHFSEGSLIVKNVQVGCDDQQVFVKAGDFGTLAQILDSGNMFLDEAVTAGHNSDYSFTYLEFPSSELGLQSIQIQPNLELIDVFKGGEEPEATKPSWLGPNNPYTMVIKQDSDVWQPFWFDNEQYPTNVDNNRQFELAINAYHSSTTIWHYFTIDAPNGYIAMSRSETEPRFE